MRVVVDAMGGDHAPEAVILGVKQFLSEGMPRQIYFNRAKIPVEESCAGLSVTIVDAPDVVGMDESPSVAVKTRQHSSIAVATRLLKEGKADALAFDGNSGATVAFGVFILGRMDHIHRPALVAPMPTLTGVTLVIDVGATVDCKPTHLLQFAAMGSVYSHYVFGVESPKVGLLSIGKKILKEMN